jgi:hypothetical protein
LWVQITSLSAYKQESLITDEHDYFIPDFIAMFWIEQTADCKEWLKTTLNSGDQCCAAPGTGKAKDLQH